MERVTPKSKSKISNADASASSRSTFHVLRSTYSRGAAILTAVFFFLVISLLVIFGASPLVLRESRTVRDLVNTKKSFYLAEAALEDAVVRAKRGVVLNASESVLVGSTIVPLTVTVLADGNTRIVASAHEAGTDLYRKVTATLPKSENVSFFYGIQAGAGGFTLDNNATVIGNIHSNGTIIGSSNNLIKGDIISALSAGRVEAVHATGSVYAHTIVNSTIDKNAYYQTISGSTVGGTSNPGSPDQATTTFAITDAQIDEWKQEALAGGTISSPCPYVVGSDIIIGPKKIDCDFTVTNGKTVTLTGPIWVNGTVTLSNNVIVRADPSLGSASARIIAENPLNRTTSSKVNISNNVSFLGSGDPNSFVLVISQNNSAELSGTQTAIDYSNNAAGGLLLYASHGKIAIDNNSALTAVTGYRIHMSNNASVEYKQGISNLNFTGGSGGGFDIKNWLEVE